MSEFTAAPIGCLIMAAGNASRFGENKLTAIFAGKSLFSLALAAIPADTFARVTVVSQYPALLQEAEQAGFHAIRNDRPDDGISRTIRLGTEAMADCAGILYMVADQPLLRQETVLRIVQDWRQHPGCIVGAAHNGHRGNPCLFPARFFPELCALEGDRGGSAVIRQYPERYLAVDVPPEALADVDTPEALRALREEK